MHSAVRHQLDSFLYNADKASSPFRRNYDMNTSFRSSQHIILVDNNMIFLSTRLCHQKSHMPAPHADFCSPAADEWFEYI